jgi:hypothetical protein
LHCRLAIFSAFAFSSHKIFPLRKMAAATVHLNRIVKKQSEKVDYNSALGSKLLTKISGPAACTQRRLQRETCDPNEKQINSVL